jgi:hypothetical protein
VVSVRGLASSIVLLSACGAQSLQSQPPGPSTGDAAVRADGGQCLRNFSNPTVWSDASGWSDASVWSDGSTDGAAPVSPDWIAAECHRPGCSPLMVTSVSMMQTTLTRRWGRCSELGLFHLPHDGIQINADGTYVFLAWSGGALLPESGDGATGLVEYLDTSAINGKPTIQVNFLTGPLDAGGWEVVSDPEVNDDPPILSINNNGVETYHYLALP